MAIIIDINTMLKVKRIHELTHALAQEKTYAGFLKQILEATRDITNADGGSLYSVTKDNTLKFEVIINKSLNIALDRNGGEKVNFKDLKLYSPDGSPNFKNIACFCAITKKIVNIEDVYNCQDFNFQGSKIFDQQVNYRTKSVLAMPLIDINNEVLGVIQLINAKTNGDELTAFQQDDIGFVELLASHAAITIANYLMSKKLESLFISFAHAIATAIDNKSPYTGKHCERVPEIVMMLASAANQSSEEPFEKFILTDQKFEELQLAALLHDCGKVSTPVHVMDKSTKLETIFDRIELVATRFEMAICQRKTQFLQDKLDIISGKCQQDMAAISTSFEQDIEKLKNDLEFLKRINIGAEFMPRSEQERVREIATRTWKNFEGREYSLLSENEALNLMVAKGTLTDQERDLINDHSKITLDILSNLDFPDHLKSVPDIAASHHEKPNGKGHPRKLSGAALSIEARMLSIADTFEALTAKDRPYKKGKTLQEALNIMGTMVGFGELDENLFQLFIDKQIYQSYGEKYLDPNQLEKVDTSKIPNYQPPEVRIAKRTSPMNLAA